VCVCVCPPTQIVTQFSSCVTWLSNLSAGSVYNNYKIWTLKKFYMLLAKVQPSQRSKALGVLTLV